MSGIRVLLVDDDPRMLDFLWHKLPWDAYGMQVAGSADNGKRAMAWLAAQPADLVITDIKMPQMDGNALIRQARAIQPSLAFIVLSSYGDYALVKDAFKQGVWDYVLKVDIDSQVMLDALETARERIERRRADGVATGEADEALTERPAGQRPRAGFFFDGDMPLRENPAVRKEALQAADDAKGALRDALHAQVYDVLRTRVLSLLDTMQTLRPERSLVLEIAYDIALYIAHLLFDMNLLPGRGDQNTTAIEPAFETPAMRGAIAQVESFAVLRAWFIGWVDALERHYRLLRGDKLMQVIRIYVDHNFSNEEAMRAIPRQFGISAGYLSKQFYRETGIHLKAYTTTLRIALAKKHLIETDASIAEVAQAVGYNNPEHFSRSFKGIVGVSPLQYKTLAVRGE